MHGCCSPCHIRQRGRLALHVCHAAALCFSSRSRALRLPSRHAGASPRLLLQRLGVGVLDEGAGQQAQHAAVQLQLLLQAVPLHSSTSFLAAAAAIAAAALLAGRRRCRCRLLLQRLSSSVKPRRLQNRRLHSTQLLGCTRQQLGRDVAQPCGGRCQAGQRQQGGRQLAPLRPAAHCGGGAVRQHRHLRLQGGQAQRQQPHALR